MLLIVACGNSRNSACLYLTGELVALIVFSYCFGKTKISRLFGSLSYTQLIQLITAVVVKSSQLTALRTAFISSNIVNTRYQVSRSLLRTKGGFLWYMAPKTGAPFEIAEAENL